MARDRQRQRTRKDLLEAAARLIAAGGTPTLDEVAEAALVSRATAYRYFSGVDALLVEATLDMAAPEPRILLGSDVPRDLVGQLEFVDDAFDAMIRRHEGALRLMMVHALQRRLRGEDELPVRQNRRMPLIEGAIAIAGDALTPQAADRLAKALALVIGTESMLVCKDVLQIDDDEARAMRHWAIAALTGAAQAESQATAPSATP